MFKKILIGVILLVLMGSVAACGGAQVAPTPNPQPTPAPTPSSQPTPATPEPTVTPEAPKAVSVDTFIKNALDGKYKKGDEVIISGEINGVVTIVVGRTIVYLIPEDEMLPYVVKAYFNKPNNPYGLREGQKIIVKGRYSRLYEPGGGPASSIVEAEGVLLEDCELIKVLQ